jgi:hypothetical protein
MCHYGVFGMAFLLFIYHFLRKRRLVLTVEGVGADGEHHGEGDVDGGEPKNDERVVDGMGRVVVLK